MVVFNLKLETDDTLRNSNSARTCQLTKDSENPARMIMVGVTSLRFYVRSLCLVLLAGRCQSAKWQVAVGYAWLANGTREKGGGRRVKRLFGYVGLDLN